MNDAIHIQDLRVWAHVGVLERERLEGQWFSLDLTLLVDLEVAARSDALTDTADYSLAVQAVQALASELRCRTIEHFSERVLNRLVDLYGAVPMRVLLRKTTPPIPGFSGTVAVERHRHWPDPRCMAR
jgi:dihydroneopterin aldolase